MAFPQNERLTEGLCFPDVINAYPTLTTAQLGAAIDLSKIRKVAFFVYCGTIGSGGTVTAKIKGCATSGGSYTDITNYSLTLTDAASESNKGKVLEVSAQNVNALGLSYRFVKLSVGADQSSAVYTATIGGGGPEEPINAQNSASVTKLSMF